MDSFKIIEKLLGSFPVKNLDGVLLVSSGAIISLPSVALEALRVAEVANQHRDIIGVVFLVSAASLIVRGLAILSKHVIKCAANHAARKRQERILQTLSKDEQKILREFATSQYGEILLDRGQKAIVSLVDKGVLIDAHPAINEKAPLRYYRVAPAYMNHVDSYFRV